MLPLEDNAMSPHDPTLDETYDPPAINRFKVEAAMLEMIEHLQGQGLSQAEIALTLADAAEDYVIRLANLTTPEDLEDKSTPPRRH
jgi:hypothetical protein